MALVYLSCDDSALTIYDDGTHLLPSCTSWSTVSADELLDGTSVLGLTIDEASTLLTEFIFLMATVFVIRVIAKQIQDYAADM